MKILFHCNKPIIKIINIESSSITRLNEFYNREILFILNIILILKVFVISYINEVFFI